jgi:phosphomevalonate kinase
LDPNCSGLVLATTARFYVTIEDSNDKLIKVNSRQLDWQGIYEMQLDKLERLKGSENKFVETAIYWTLKYLGLTYVSLHIEIRTDNDFYSQYDTLKEMQLPISSESLEKVPKFNKLLKFHKTGLGSSAALVTSLVSGLFIHTISM